MHTATNIWKIITMISWCLAQHDLNLPAAATAISDGGLALLVHLDQKLDVLVGMVSPAESLECHSDCWLHQKNLSS